MNRLPDLVSKVILEAREKLYGPDPVSKVILEAREKLYGPKYCPHCKKTQPVETFVLQGTEQVKMEGYTSFFSYTGQQFCAVCRNLIEQD